MVLKNRQETDPCPSSKSCILVIDLSILSILGVRRRFSARPKAPQTAPDSHWIGFFAAEKVKKIPAAGGPVQVVAETGTDFRGGTWGPEDTILFVSGIGELLRVNSTGGKATPLTRINTSQNVETYRTPHFLQSTARISGTVKDQTGALLPAWPGSRRVRSKYGPCVSLRDEFGVVLPGRD